MARRITPEFKQDAATAAGAAALLTGGALAFATGNQIGAQLSDDRADSSASQLTRHDPGGSPTQEQSAADREFPDTAGEAAEVLLGRPGDLHQAELRNDPAFLAILAEDHRRMATFEFAEPVRQELGLVADALDARARGDDPFADAGRVDVIHAVLVVGNDISRRTGLTNGSYLDGLGRVFNGPGEDNPEVNRASIDLLAHAKLGADVELDPKYWGEHSDWTTGLADKLRNLALVDEARPLAAQALQVANVLDALATGNDPYAFMGHDQITGAMRAVTNGIENEAGLDTTDLRQGFDKALTVAIRRHYSGGFVDRSTHRDTVLVSDQHLDLGSASDAVGTAGISFGETGRHPRSWAVGEQGKLTEVPSDPQAISRLANHEATTPGFAR